ncbi:MAG: translocation/assembly module TamB domain-containing protein [Taibaiella sp.]|nr:translocation/assembly module TamB domain-containing protein [Taibaiella sp.]
MRKFIKITLCIIGGILLLLIGAIVYINTPSGQNFVRGKAESFLQDKLKTEVKIGYLNVGFPKFVVLSNILVRDQRKDTLLGVQELKVDVALLRLLHKELIVEQVMLKGVNANVYRTAPDTNFNYTFIIDAFAGKDKKEPTKPETDKKEKSSAFKIDVDKVKLDDIRLRFDDYTGGSLLSVKLTHLDLRIEELNLDSMKFHVKELNIDGLATTYLQDTSYLPVKPKDTGKTQLRLVADNVHLNNIAVNYNDNLNKLLFGLQLGELALELKNFDLAKNKIDINKLAIHNTSSQLVMGKYSKPPAIVDTIIKKDSVEGWLVNAGELDFSGINFKMDNENEPRQQKGIDYAHLDLCSLAINMKQLNYNSDSISGDLRHFAVKEKSGVDVQELKTVFHYNQQGAVLEDLYLLTPHTVLQHRMEAHYPSLDALKKDTRNLAVNINVEKSIIGFADILIFAPQLKSQEIFQKYPNAQIRLDAVLAGKLDKLFITRFHVLSMNSTEIDLNGRLSGLPEADNINYNLHITKLISSRKAIEDLVADTLLSSVRIPDRFNIRGNVAGTIKSYQADLNVGTTDGNAYLKGMLSMAKKGAERYDMLVQTEKLNLGRILKKDSLIGEVSAAVTVKGSGFDPKNMTAELNGAVGQALLKNYNYHDIIFKGDVKNQAGNLTLSSADSNLRVKVDGHADFAGKYPAVKADILMDSIDFRALHLYATELRARGIIHADFPVLNPDYPYGSFVWKKPTINADGKRYYLDSMYIVAKSNENTGQDITVNLDIITARVTGKIPLTKTGAIIQERISRRYTMPAADSVSVVWFNTTTNRSIASLTKDTTTLPTRYDMKLTATVIDKPMLHSILPGLTSFDSIHVDGSLTERALSLNVAMPSIVYGEYVIQNGLVKVNGTDSAFAYALTVDKVASKSFALWNANVYGNLDQERVTANISISDSLKKERFALAANMVKVGDSQIFNLQPGLKLDYQDWTVAAGNRIVSASKGIYINNFEISNNGQFIRASSEQQVPDAPINIEIRDFLLSNITNTISKGDTLLANGLLAGKVRLQHTATSAQVDGDMKITNLSYRNDTLGDLLAQVSIKDPSTLDAKVTLNGKGNDITLSGAYYIKQQSGNDLKMDLDVKALAVRSFETLAMNQIKESKGYVRGKLAIEGKLTSPVITGELHTDNLETTVTTIHSYFKMPNESITFSKNLVSFKDFTIMDSANNKATITGTVNTEDLSDVGLDLTLKANKWRGLHSTEGDNKVFYGDLMLTTNLTVRGSALSPIVDGNIDVLKGTKLTIITPETKQEIESHKGIVAFINMKDTARRNLLAPKEKVAANTKFSKGSDINVNINIDKEAAFSLVIDQASGDFLSVKGDASLNASITPAGTFGLTGNYELHGGEYQLNYNFIKRKFVIRDGSTITFAGDPVKSANMNITAAYEINVPPYDLVERQVSDPAQLNYYKQRLPFDVNLYMKGQILQPALSFDIILPDNKVYPLATDQIELIQGKLNQIRNDTSELNKQVFAVLILSRFVSDDPFRSEASSSIGFTALQSVSTFIGEQLNQAAGKFVKGVDFTVDLATSEDYTSGDMRQRTDLNLAASKRLLNDRLKLTLGNNFELDGPKTSNEQSSYIPSNLAADYLLSADGKYTLRGYRRAYDEGVLQGYVTETGLNFIVSLDYNEFKNILKKKKKPNEPLTQK